MDTTTSKLENEESILVAFNEREKKLASLRRAGKTSPTLWVVLLGAWLAAAWAVYLKEIPAPFLMVATILLTALGNCFQDYRTRLKILSDHLTEEVQTRPLGEVSRVHSVQKF